MADPIHFIEEQTKWGSDRSCPYNCSAVTASLGSLTQWGGKRENKAS